MDDYPEDNKRIFLESRSVDNEHTWQYIARLLKSQKDGRAVMRYLRNNEDEAMPMILLVKWSKDRFSILLY